MTRFLDNQIPAGIVEPGQQNDMAVAFQTRQTWPVGRSYLDCRRTPGRASCSHIFGTLSTGFPRRSNAAYKDNARLVGHMRRIDIKASLAVSLERQRI